MRTSRTLSALIIALAVLFLPGSDCIKLNWGGSGGPGGGTGGSPCGPAGTLQCIGSDIERCDGQYWIRVQSCPPQVCATTPKGVGCYDCPGDGVTQCGPAPYNEVLTCVWRESDATLQWQTTNCHDQSPTATCWGLPESPRSCFEIEAKCPFDRNSEVVSTSCQGDTLLVCWPPTIVGGVVIFDWVPRECPSGTACRVVSGQGGTCRPIGIGGDTDGGV